MSDLKTQKVNVEFLKELGGAKVGDMQVMYLSTATQLEKVGYIKVKSKVKPETSVKRN